MKDIFIEAHIADIHFGAMDVNKQYKILKEQFIDRLMDMPILDIVSINGDLFHHKFMANSTVVLVALQFIYDLIGVCKAKDATLIVISGTYSHDADQIKLIYPLAQQAWDNGVDVRIVEKISFERIKNKLVLCIPEEYGKPMQYYTDPLYHSGIYDACYMHGTFKGSIIVTFDTFILLSEANFFTFSSLPINTALANPSFSTSAAACITRTSSLSGNNIVLMFCLAFSFIVSTKDISISSLLLFYDNII